ncbi:MAG TPA: hypothetical protein ENG59_08005 [Chloroflexi bacterium]|nr:MAG: hypothetical protein DRI46_00750 [Chloroflexota bacterium]HDD56168.1 hypothetical protein [Chloroflexota bacterium]
MDSGMIGKIQKSKQYATERERIKINALSVTFRGQNNAHQVSFKDGQWRCDCDFFQTRERCSHTMALERILIQEANLSLDEG